MNDVAIITPHYLASTPRVVREADALAAAGLRVVVVHTQGPLAHLRAWDADLLADRAWRARPIRWSRRPGERLPWLAGAAARKLARGLHARGVRLRTIAGLGEESAALSLFVAAVRTPARLYVGHYPAGLVASALAASARGRPFAYDAEDLHHAEDGHPDGPEHLARVDTIERGLLRGAAHISAASEGIAEALAARLGVPRPLVVHNVLPWRARAAIDGARRSRVGTGRSLTWFSQTIGLDRGLQHAIAALGDLPPDVELHLRGACAPDVRRRLTGLAKVHGAAGRVHVHEPVPPAELLARTAEHDIGLALEGAAPRFDLTVSNKLFTYLTAGLAVVATPTTGQRRVFATTPGIGRLAEGEGPAAVAEAVRGLLEPSGRLAAARATALAAAEGRWSWEREGAPLVAALRAVLAGGPP